MARTADPAGRRDLKTGLRIEFDSCLSLCPELGACPPRGTGCSGTAELPPWNLLVQSIPLICRQADYYECEAKQASEDAALQWWHRGTPIMRHISSACFLRSLQTGRTCLLLLTPLSMAHSIDLEENGSRRYWIRAESPRAGRAFP